MRISQMPFSNSTFITMLIWYIKEFLKWSTISKSRRHFSKIWGTTHIPTCTGLKVDTIISILIKVLVLIIKIHYTSKSTFGIVSLG